MYIDNYAIVRIVLNLLANYICNYISTSQSSKNNIKRKDETVNTTYVENKTSSDNVKDKMDNLLEMTLT